MGGPLTESLVKDQGLEEQILSEKLFAAEKRLTAVRLVVIAANTLIYTLLMDKAGTIPSLAYAVIGVAWAYALYVYMAQPYRHYAILRSSYFTSASDSALIVVWLHATGGFQSPFYLLLYISVVAISFRYPLKETVFAAWIYAVTYGGLLAASGELSEHWSDAVVRITYIFIAAMLGATISSEVLQQILSKFKLQEQLRREEQAKLREAQDAERRWAALALENERLFEREKVARARAEASEQHYRVLAESIPQIVWTAKPDGTIDYTNRAWSTYVGESAAAVLFTDWHKIVHPDEVANIEERWSRCLLSGEPYEAEHRLRRADGVYRWFLVRGVPMRGAQGEIARWFVTCTDVEAFKRAESELQNAIKLREDFLSIAGHELKTPLTALQLQVDGVGRLAAARAAETNIGAKVLQRLEKASAHLRRVNRMVEDLLDVSRIKAGRLELEKEDFDLAQMAQEVITRYSETAAKQGCRIEFRDTDHPIGHWDRNRLEQVLTNLLANAIKYGSGKPIEIEVSDRNGWAVLKVRDHGIGIPPEDQQRIFERFERAVSEHRFGGFGLGLWIAKRIIEASGGEILLDSAVGQGATFSVVLPLQPPGSVSHPFAAQTRA